MKKIDENVIGHAELLWATILEKFESFDTS